MRLAAGNDDNWPVKEEETSDTPVVKKEVEYEEMGRYGSSSTKKKPDFGEIPEAKRRKLIPAVEANSYVIQQGLNAEVKEEVEPFPAVIGYVPPPSSGQTGGSLPFPNGMSDNQVFNAHDFFANEAIVKEELNEEEEEQEGEGMDQTADYNDSEKQVNEEKVCPVDGCSEKFSSEEALCQHMRIHPKPLLCRVCQRAWASAADLRVHHRIHSGEKPFNCPYCNRTFTHGSNLKQHIRLHTGELPFECDRCDMKFAQSAALKYHRSTHTGDKAFACTLCGYRSPSAGNLTIHMRSHTGQKPFECSDCGHRFARKGDMERHKEAVHLGLKKYSCEECDYKAARQSLLSSHVKRKHKK